MFSATLAVKRKLSSATKAISRAQRADVDLAHVGAVDQDRALARVVEAGDQRDQAGLARARGPDQGHRAPGLDLEVDRRSGRPAGRSRARPRSARRDAAQLDAAAARRAAAARPGGLSIRGSRSRISNRRLPEAIARCAIPIAIPSIRIGPASITR